MFAKNSRYATVPTSSPVDAKGENLLGTNVRIIPPATGTFQHRVLGRDRLDLLALKYYGDPTRWWQISDANPEVALPTDLLDRTPIQEELLSLASPAMQARFDNLIAALTAAGESVLFPLMDLPESSLVVLQMTPAIRTQTIADIGAAGLHFMRSFAWADGVTTGEIFYFEDLAAKQNWRALLEDLLAASGVLEVRSVVEDLTVNVVYNGAVISRGAILTLIGRLGFELVPASSQQVVQAGTQIVIPPNTVS